MTIRRFTNGIGRLDARTLNDLMRTNSVAQFAQTPPFAFRGRWYGPILCQINDSTQQAGLGRSWRYEVVEVTLDGADTFSFPADGFESTKVYNLAEFANTAAESSGIDNDDLPGTYVVKAIPDDAIVPVWVGAVEGSNELVGWFDRANEFDGACDTASLTAPTPFPVQWLQGYFSASNQITATEVVDTRHVIDVSIGAERYAANSLRLWNGSEALNAGATLVSGRYRFASTTACRSWWDNYTVRVNINDEGWQYLNSTDDEATTVGGSALQAALNASPAVSWSGSDFATNVNIEIQVFDLPTGGPAND